MTNLLEDLDERELNSLIASARMVGGQFLGMSDSDVLLELIAGRVEVDALASRCQVKKVLRRLARLNGMVLRNVPESERDRGMCADAVRQNGQAIQFVPEPLRDLEMCLLAIKDFGLALQFVPAGLVDRKMCLAAVRQSGSAIRSVPERLRDKEICMEAIRYSDGWIREEFLTYIPERLRDLDMCVEAVRMRPAAIKYVPGPLRVQVRKELGLDRLA